MEDNKNNQNNDLWIAAIIGFLGWLFLIIGIIGLIIGFTNPDSFLSIPTGITTIILSLILVGFGKALNLLYGIYLNTKKDNSNND